MTVLHSSMDEFVAELERDAAQISDKIIRMETRAIRWTGGVIPVLATCVGYKCRGEVVELQAVAGEIWAGSLDPKPEDPWAGKDQPNREILAATEQAIRDLAAQHGLDLRAGRFA